MQKEYKSKNPENLKTKNAEIMVLSRRKICNRK